MVFSADEWSSAARSLLFLSGVTCCALALHDGGGATGLFLRVWVGGFGLLLAGSVLWRAEAR